jgi:hypothetical protein
VTGVLSRKLLITLADLNAMLLTLSYYAIAQIRLLAEAFFSMAPLKIHTLIYRKLGILPIKVK